MSKNEIKFDCAISFMAKDEDIANHLYNLLSKDFRIFVYSKKQEKVVGTDGTESFSKVFKKESSFNIVLFRKGWSETPWTRIEKDAIVEKMLNEGWDNLLIIKLDDSDLPVWVPKQYIYLKFSFYNKINEVAAIIKQKLIENGRVPREESIDDLVNRKENEIKLKKKIAEYLNSPVAFEDALEEFEKIKSEIGGKIQELEKNRGILRYRIDEKTEKTKFSNNYIRIVCSGVFFMIEFVYKYQNSVSDSYIRAYIYRKQDELGLREREEFKDEKFTFEMTCLEQIGWIEERSKNFWHSDKIVDKWLRELTEIASKLH